MNKNYSSFCVIQPEPRGWRDSNKLSRKMEMTESWTISTLLLLLGSSYFLVDWVLVISSRPDLICNNMEIEESLDNGSNHVLISIHTPAHQHGKSEESSGNVTMEAAPIVDDAFPSEILKTFLCLLFLLLGMAFTAISVVIANELVPSPHLYPPLPDLVFMFISRRLWMVRVSEILGLLLHSIFWLLILTHKYRLIIVRRFCIILSLLYTLRSVTMLVTVLPVTNHGHPCLPKVGITNVSALIHHTLHLCVSGGLSLKTKHVTCGDYIFSGHTIFLLANYMFIREYTPTNSFKYVALHVLACLACYLGIAFILIGRFHYTIDVIIAYVFYTRLFWSYHTLANNKNTLLHHHNHHCYHKREIWFKLLEWSEHNVRGVIPNDYEFPVFPCLTRVLYTVKLGTSYVKRSLHGFKYL